MCGRFTLTIDPGELQDAFPGYTIPQQGISPRYNIAPSQPIAAILNQASPKLDFLVWGLIPSWVKDPQMGNRMINARSETLAEKPSFRNAYRRRRCLIPADGFYEWQVIPGRKSKQPVYIHLQEHKPFAFAGLWEIWRAPDGSEVYSAAIITTQANDFIKPIHDRMPVILKPSNYEEWLDAGERHPETLAHLLVPYPNNEMAAYPVSQAVNSPQNDQPECIKPMM
jgi:putative SOS response-associated peptidase YedK